MAILNYTTTIEAEKSIMELEKLLVKMGASSITKDLDEQGPFMMRFVLWINDEKPIGFELPARVDGVLAVLQKDKSVPNKYKNAVQARRVAWRILKDWTEAQLAIIQAGLAEPLEVFLPYAILQGGNTVYASMSHSDKFLLNE